MLDLLIIGGGPAGLTAGIYAERALLDCKLIEKQGVGGQIALSHLIENYPGFPAISGVELMEKFEQHAIGAGLEIIFGDVQSINKGSNGFNIKTGDSEIKAKSVIVATGAKPKRLEVPEEERLIGRGVSFCATCDAPFFKGMDVAVVGGGNSAIKEADFLTKYVNKVFLVHRRKEFRAEKISQEKLKSNPKVEFVLDSVVEAITGRQAVEAIKVKNLLTNQHKEIGVGGVFVFIGTIPVTRFVDVEKDSHGFIVTDKDQKTSVEGIFAAGDCCSNRVKQVAAAVGDGTKAALSAQDYIELIS
jgi:thioredoxin reductase (NADPH)